MTQLREDEPPAESFQPTGMRKGELDIPNIKLDKAEAFRPDKLRR